MNPALSLNTLAQIFSEQIGNCLAGGMVIFFCAAWCSHLLRRESSGTRFVIWFAGLVAMAGIPLLAIPWFLGEPPVSSVVKPATAAVTLPGSWALYLFLAWSLIASAAWARIAAGFWRVWALRRRSAALDTEDLAPELQETLVRFRPSRKVAVLLSDEVQSPTAIGLMSPAIVLPKWLFEELSDAELRQIFLHELAHLQRWDDWSNLFQKIVKGLFFFHPAVWWMERQVSLEREMACDEAVLAQTGNPSAYAQCLVLLAEKSFFRRSALLAQAAVSRAGQTALRIARILHPALPHTPGKRKLIAPPFAAALLASLALLARAPRLIAFESSEPVLARAQIALQVPPRVVAASFATSSSISVSAPSKPDAGISSANFHPRVVATTTRALAANLCRERPGNMSLAAKLDFGANGQSTAKMRQDASSELLVIFVESRPDGVAVPAVWQIQMWHITVLWSQRNPARQGNPQKVI